MPAAGTRPPGTVKRNGKAPRPHNRPIALPGRIHALGRQGADQPPQTRVFIPRARERIDAYALTQFPPAMPAGGP